MVPKQIFLNGNVITMNSQAPEATAFGVLGTVFGRWVPMTTSEKWQTARQKS